MSSFFLHLHAPAVRASSLVPRRTLGLGLVAASLVVLVCASGFLLSAYYAPTATDAYASVLAIEDGVLFGAWVRAAHRWGAYALLVTALLHALRVLASGADRLRRLNWHVGLALAMVAWLLTVTGYLLPWDGAALAAARVSSGLLSSVPFAGELGLGLLHGGEQVGALALVRANALHAAVLPLALIALGAWHLWHIRKDGGLVGEPGDLVPAWPHLVLREAVVLAAVGLALALLSALVSAPLGPAAGAPVSVEKAPWFLLGLQQLAAWSPTACVLVPALVIVLAAALPSLQRRSRTVALAMLAGLAAAYLGFTLLGACRGPFWRLAWPWEGGCGL